MSVRPPGAARLEAWIVARLRESAGLPEGQPDPEADFSALGVDSVALAGVLGKLEKKLGRTLDPFLLSEYPSARRLADALARVLDSDGGAC